MKIPTVRSCCCFDVRFGSMVIACLELAYAVVGLIDGVRIAAISTGESSATVHTSSSEMSPSPDGASEYTFVLKDKSVVKRLAKLFFWFHLAETIGVLVIASLLVHGIMSKRRSFFMPWLGIHFLATIIFGVLIVIIPFGVMVEYGTEMAGAGLAGAVGCLCAFVINGYLTVVVYSHYQELGVEKARLRAANAHRTVEIVCMRPDYTPSDQSAPDMMQPPAYDEIVKNKEGFPPAGPY